MTRRLLTSIAAILILAACASHAAGARVSVGLVPFTPAASANGQLTHAVPGLIGWEMGRIPGIDTVPLQDTIACMSFDRLAPPGSVDDRAAYSALAQSLGVRYIVAGQTRGLGASRLRFEVFVYSSKDPSFRREFDYTVPVASVPRAVAGAARDVAQSLGVRVPDRLGERTVDARPRSLLIVDQALRMDSQLDADYSDIRKVAETAERVAGDPAIGPYAKFLSALRQFGRGSEELEPLSKSEPHNIAVISGAFRADCEDRQFDRARRAALMWTKADPASPLAQLALKEVASFDSPRVAPERRGKRSDRTDPMQAAESVESVIPEELGWRMRLAEAEIYGMTRSVPRAQYLFDRLIREHPRSAYIRVVAGRAYLRRRRYPQALQSLDQAIKLCPDSYRLYVLLADSYRWSGDLDNSLQTADLLTRRWPNKSQGHAIRAAALQRVGRNEEAMDEYRTAAQLDPERGIDHVAIAEGYIETGRIIDAVRELARGEPQVRRGLIIGALVLTGVFFVAVMGVVLMVRLLTGPSKPRGPDTERQR